MKHIVFFCFLISTIITATAQTTIEGVFLQHKGEEIRLKGFDGFKEKVFSNDTISKNGQFSLTYPATYKGVGVVEIKGKGSLLVILANEKKLTVNGESIQDYTNIKINNSKENSYLDTYIKQQGVRNSKLDGWKWLKPIYKKQDSLSPVLSYINKEITNLETEETAYIQTIPKKQYLSYYLPLRKLVEDRPASINRYVARIPQHVLDFKSYNLADKKLWKSGLMQQFYEGHFVMLEQFYGVSDADGKNKMNASIDYVLENLTGYDDELLEVSEYLFKLFEKRSLFSAAEYISLKMLAQNSCTVDGELERKFEQYRAMKEGGTAPKIVFENKNNNILRGFKNNEKSLNEIKSKYKLVVFWASWCDHCKVEMPKLQSLYATQLKGKKIEVVSVSLDTNRQSFLSTSAGYEWYSYCDFKKWESKPVKDYFVFSTPSYYLLDENNIILKKIKSIGHLKAVLPSL